MPLAAVLLQTLYLFTCMRYKYHSSLIAFLPLLVSNSSAELTSHFPEMIHLPFGIGNLGSCFLKVCRKLICAQWIIIYCYPLPFHKLLLEHPSPCVPLKGSMYPVALQSPVPGSLCTPFVIILTFVSASEADKSLLSRSLAGDCLTPWLSCLYQPCPFSQGSAVHGPPAGREA